MAIIQWDAEQTLSAVFAPGDIIVVSGASAGSWELSVAGNDVLLHAYDKGTLTLRSADGSPLTPAQLSMTLPDGGKFFYVPDDVKVVGGEGNDVMLGSGSANTLDGGAGDDVLQGGDGNDTLTGGSGDNLLVGGAGDDRLTGDAGQDILNGGAGNDTLDSGGGPGNLMTGDVGDDRYIVRSHQDIVWDPAGNDSGMIYADWFKASPDVEHWEWAPGVQKLPYWIDALVWPTSTYAPVWLGKDPVVRYSFAQLASDYTKQKDQAGFQPFTQAQINYARNALDYIRTLIDVRFEETFDTGASFSIVMGNNSQDNSSGYASSIYNGAGSPLLLNNVPQARFPGRDDGAYLNAVLLHELGHSLGMKHPFSHPDSVGGIDTAPYLPDTEDSTTATRMSYSGEFYMYKLEYSPLDIAALQYLWGVSPQAHPGDSRYLLSAGESQMIWDGNGTDTIDGSALQSDLTLYLEPGYWSHAGAQAATITAPGQYTVNFGTEIENALGGAGNDAITGNALANRIDGGHGDDTVAGGAGNDVLRGEAGNDRLTGGAGDDGLFGGAGDDVLAGGTGDDRLDGGEGTDTATFSGTRSDYTVAASQDGWTVTSTGAASGTDGNDTLSGIERLRFTDSVTALDTGKDGVAGQVYRLYQAAFDRKPDGAGLAYWMAQADHGTPVDGIAGSFLRSDEFAKLYGGANPTDATYLAQLYHNVLHRPYDQGGYDYWLGVMKQGAARTDILLSFAASDENVDAVAKVIGQGFDYGFYG